MKKIKFQKIFDEGLFKAFQSNKLNSLYGMVITGGTSTVLCKTTAEDGDTDSDASQESSTDPRCKPPGY